MRILNVVEMLNGKISQILSFPVIEEQLSQDVIEEAESTFGAVINEVTGLEDLDDIISEWYYSDDNGWELSIIWSETN
jgi:hypothetical protein